MRFKKTKSQASELAVQDAKAHVQEAHEQSREVHEVADALRRARQQNHFAEQISIMMGYQKGV